MSKKKIIILLIGIVLALNILLTVSYSVFVISTSRYKASEMLVSNLVYGINIEPTNKENTTVEGKSVRVLEGSTTTILVKITSLNPVESKYSLEYKVNEGVANVYYSYSTGWLPSGKINKSGRGVYEKTVKVVIEAISESEVEFNVSGGYTYNDAPDTIIGYSKIEEEYDKVEIINEANLKEIIESNTTNNTYGGESKNNYLEYGRLWRILGKNEIGIKLISEKYETVVRSNVGDSLTSIYDVLPDKSDYIENTNKFNCSLIGCMESSYNSVGLISTYEYELVGGLNSYLAPTEDYFSINNSNIMNITRGGIEETTEGTISGIRASIYLRPDVNVTGSGTYSDPYRIISVGKVVTIKYKVNGKIVETEPLKSDPYIVDKVECTNGAEGIWDEEASAVVLTKEKYPTTCTVNFKEGYAVALTGIGVSIEAPTNKTVGRIGTTTFNVTANSGYTLTNSSLSCPSAKIERNNNIITITNIKENQTCTINAIELPKVTLKVNNGTGSTTKTAASVGGSLTFSIGANNGYTITNASKSCNGGASISISGSTVTVSNINSTQTCTVSTVALPKVTLVVNNGSGGTSKYASSSGSNVSFTNVKPNSGYTVSGASVSCNGGSTGTISGTTVTIKSVTKTQTCTVTMKMETGQFYNKILADNPTKSTRTDFRSGLDTTTQGIIYSTIGEDNKTTVYYYAGGYNQNNWVQFGKDKDGNYLYWRIIRTNADKGIRLLYSGSISSPPSNGSVPKLTNAYIGESKYNNLVNSCRAVGYMYGSSGSLAKSRENTNSSTVKQTIDAWYANGLKVKTDGSNVYDKYVSKGAIYCNDRAHLGNWLDTSPSKGDDGGSMWYVSQGRNSNFSPSLVCGTFADYGSPNLSSQATGSEDRFSASTRQGGNGKLTYPIALITLDEVFFSGNTTWKSLNNWLTCNLDGNCINQGNEENLSINASWGTMSPKSCGTSSMWRAAEYFGINRVGQISSSANVIESIKIRPVISLKSCVTVTGGNGSVSSPYTVGLTSACAAYDE